MCPHRCPAGARSSRVLALIGLLIVCYALNKQLTPLPSDHHHHHHKEEDDDDHYNTGATDPSSPSSSSSSSSSDQSPPPFPKTPCLEDGAQLPQRHETLLLTDFGGVGDGLTLNTQAFQRAIAHVMNMRHSQTVDNMARRSSSGAQLIIPPGKWLTGCFNLTSHLTVYLQKGATILASQDPQQWPLIDPLPSYGRGRERPGRRYSSLIHGEDLEDVIITGENGTIDGQGSAWWERWWNRSLQHTRGHLVEFLRSKDIVISNVTLQNSPFWTVHPVYCNRFIVKNVTILAPFNAPNTDGIDPDSSTNVCIEDCHISNGDDLIAIKSGWDQYGINSGLPSVNITIRRVSGTTPTCSGIAIGSEVSGGISNVHVEDVHVYDTSAGIRLKTAPGRGGFITNVTVLGMTMERVKRAIDFSGDAGEHPNGESFNHTAFSVVKGIVMRDIVGHDVEVAGRFESVPQAPFLDICLHNISFHIVLPSHHLTNWSCSHAYGFSTLVSPPTCLPLHSHALSQGHPCYNPYI